MKLWPSTRCGKQGMVLPWTRSNSFVRLGPLQDRTTSLIASTARASKKPPRGCPSNRPTGARVRFWERLCAPGRNLPRSLRTSPLPIPNFGANGRGERPSAPDAMAKPADAAAEAIDAVRAVADVPVHAVRRRGTDAFVDERVEELLRCCVPRTATGSVRSPASPRCASTVCK